ncbi:MAG: HAD family hydrolase [Candidatus Pelagibacter sp.]|nr:HAD family hydrolase [Candidatus Pelagibacter sp.]|tara:strand:+ start:1726 stop:2415 length:690 start_codon:yes stop_codon:yes gene_type:complete
MSQDYTILFDLDGTLVDTAPDLVNAHKHVMKKFGYENKTSNDIRKLVGRGADSLITRSVWGKAKREFNEIADKKIKNEMVDEFLNFYKKNIAVESKLINGAYEFLNWAKKNKISMAVCTNKQDYLAIDLLKKINVYHFFEYVAGSNTFDYCKPDPRHLTNVIEIMNGNIKKSIMIGDSETDAEAAKSAEIPFILLENGYTEKNINEIHHDHLVKDFIDIKKVVESYLND